jgi:hypothetical protein
MSPESQELESFFQKINEAEAPFRDGSESENATERLDGFFEKLSSIDGLVLGEDASQDSSAEAAEYSGGSKRGNPARAAVRSPRGDRPHGSMRVFRSDRPEEDPFLEGPAQRAGNRGIAGNLVTACKILAAGLILFGVGLASGWAALSLPQKFEDSMASFSGRFQQGNPWMEQAPTRVEFPGARAGEPEQRENAGTAGAAKPIATAPVAATEQEEDRQQEIAAVELPVAEMFAEAPAEVQTKEAGQGRPPSQGRFAIQVGACQSPSCVKSYRELLLPHVTSEAIQVIESSTPQGGEPVQRIRVVSLTEAGARKLKASLAAADARLKDAYLITVSGSPSG